MESSTSPNWFSIKDRRSRFEAVNIFIGGRGIGKTYSSLTYCLEEQSAPFLYVRNTDSQIQSCATTFGNPFKRWNTDHNRLITMTYKKDHAEIVEETEEGILETLGYGVSLSTFENLRGIDLSDCNYAIIEEFIQKRTLMYDQYDAFCHFYETINRNRELLGEEPLKCFLLSNSQSIANPILVGFGLVGIIEGMRSSGQKRYRKPGLYLELVDDCDVSQMKRNTAIYQLTEGSDFYKESLDNDFAADSFHNIRKKAPMNEYVGYCQIDGIYVWSHKTNGCYYACRVPFPGYMFSSKDNGLAFFRRFGMRLRNAVFQDRLWYSEFLIKDILNNILKL